MKRSLVAFSAVLLTAMQAAPDEAGAQFAWLAGHWTREETLPTGTIIWTEEVWLPPRGGGLVAVSRSGGGNQMRFSEYMRIESRPRRGTWLWASPQGEKLVQFDLVRRGSQEAVFENPKHDYPQRIGYRREGDTLIATTSSLDGSRQGTYVFRLAGDMLSVRTERPPARRAQ